ncbi:DUF2231 domain-containing protein [Occallatibacter riparius]|uniref:DUF2231 domain-containing protein n=1 Tax=Occallatibacter riparius TaxID=1002689 RepID=A0A9J7BFW7_9BACT|nr:DUF2231 domain-containing protein [Occallatibacter riparius]UWZ81655.1 DUF2231 domain-containing protein [Occallatibacter riparius]
MADEIAVSKDPVARWAERQDWIRPEVEKTAQGAIHSSFELMGPAGDRVRSFLQGEWLHEPLHSAITDVPVGAWTATVTLDSLSAMCPGRGMDAAADATLWLGLLGAIASAAAGLADWAYIDEPRPRRVGAVHALLNIGATALFTASACVRKRNRNNGRALAGIGFAVVALSAHLGGNLVYEHKMGMQQDNGGSAPAESGGTGI